MSISASNTEAWRRAFRRARRLVPVLLLLVAALRAEAQGRSIPRGTETDMAAEADAETVLPLAPGQQYRYPLLNGLTVSVDVLSPLLELFSNGYADYEARATLDLHHRFLPQAVFGVGHCAETADDGYSYRVAATPYGKLGIGYIFRYNDAHARDFYYAVLRYGFSTSRADMEDLTYTDGYWPDYGPVDVLGVRYNCHWLELGGGIQVHIARRVSLGWEVWYKNLLSAGSARDTHGRPYFVPGYGTTAGHLGFQFNVHCRIF